MENKHTLIARDVELKNKLTGRLNRIEGQIRGINKMVDNDIYCDDILTQISAAKAALNAVSKLVLEHHLHGCVLEKIKNDDETIVEELLTTLNKMLK